MRRTRYFLLLAVMLVGMVARGQDFNPTSPAEPSARYQLSLAASPAEAATVSGGGKYSVNTKVAVSATATDTKWKFVNWTNSAGVEVSTSSAFTYSMSNANETLTANYVEVATSKLTIAYDPKSIATGSTNIYKVGTTVSVSASTYNYFTFRNWTNSAGDVVSEARSFSYVVTDADETLTAHYDFVPGSPSEPTETKAKHKLYFSANPASSGSFNVSNGTLVSEGSAFSVTATASTSYVFTNWTMNGEIVGTQAKYTGVMGEEDIYLVANFTFQPGSPGDPSSGSSARHTLYATTTEMYQGETTLVPIYLENTGNVKELTFVLNLPECIEADTEALQTTLRTSAYTATGSVEDHKLTVTLSGGTQIGEKNGVIVRIPVTTNSTAEDGEYPLTFGTITATNTSDAPVTVTNRPGKLVISTLEEGDLQAAFSVDRYMNRAQFTNTSTDNARSYLWDFGDGTTSTERDPMHIYDAAGTYTVKLTAKGILKTDVAEQNIIINAPNTWTANGDYTLNATGMGARNFTSMHEAISLLSQCKADGNISIQVMDNASKGVYAMDLTHADSLALVTLMNTKLTDAGVTMTFTSPEEEQQKTIDFLANSTMQDMQQVVAFMLNLKGENVLICLNGATINAAELTKYESQTVCANAPTAALPLSLVSPSDRIAVSWYASAAAGCVLSGYTPAGTGDLPSMTIANPSAKSDVINYNINVTLDGVLIHSYIYRIYVKPLLSQQAFTTTSPANGAEVAFGNYTLSWTNLNSMATGGYTVHMKRTLNDAVTDLDYDVSSNSLTINALPGASYEWWVEAFGGCDQTQTAVATFTVKKQADLTVVSVTAPEEVKANNSLTVTATIRNAGEGTTQRTSWTDALYYAPASADFSSATLVSSRTHNGALAPGAEYSASWTVTAPDASIGHVVYFVKTDSGMTETESDETNNVGQSEQMEIINKFVNDADYAALRVLYDATNGGAWIKTWKVNSNAITATAWPGVTFDEDGNVLAISLQENNLVGDLPAEGFCLPNLTSLNLSHNSLKGDIAAFCSLLPSLAKLNLSYCEFTELSDVLPTTITDLNLGYQRMNYGVNTIPMQQWVMGDSDADIVLGSLIAYDHTAQNFNAHPALQLRTQDTNTLVGRMVYSNGAYSYVLSGDYKQQSGKEYIVQPTEGTAAYTRLRAQLSWIKGDANVDAAVDVLDAQHTLNYILGTHSGSFNFLAADTYESSNINVQDVVATINLFIGDEDDNADADVTSAKPSRLLMAKATAAAAGEVVVEDDALCINTSQPVAALDITLEGITASQLKLQLSRTRYQMITHNTANGVRVVIISPTGDTVNGHATLLKLGGEASVKRVLAADADAQPVVLYSQGDATGIRGVYDNADADADHCYDLSGRKLDHVSAKGVYIVNGKKRIMR